MSCTLLQCPHGWRWLPSSPKPRCVDCEFVAIEAERNEFRARLTALEAELADERESGARLYENTAAFIANLRAQLARKDEALIFYADEGTWTGNGAAWAESGGKLDLGSVAREALGIDNSPTDAREEACRLCMGCCDRCVIACRRGDCIAKHRALLALDVGP